MQDKFQVGDPVRVLPGWSMETKSRSIFDEWADREGVVVQVLDGREVMVEIAKVGEVYLNISRLQLIIEAHK